MALNVWIILSVQQMLTCWCTGRSISEEIKVRIWIYTICIFLIIALFCRRLTVISLSILHYWSKKLFSLSFAQFGSYFTNMVLFGKECVIIFNKVSYYLKANLWKIKVWIIFYLPLAWPNLANTYKEILWVYYINRVYSDWEPIM